MADEPAAAEAVVETPADLLAHAVATLPGITAARADMGRETLAVIGATFADGRPGFYLLSDRADALSMNQGSSETLLDHDCAVLKSATR